MIISRPPAYAGGSDRPELLLLRPSFQFPYAFLYPIFGLAIMREFSFVTPECGRVVVPATVDVFGRVVDVEHLVEYDVFDNVTRDVGRVE